MSGEHWEGHRKGGVGGDGGGSCGRGRTRLLMTVRSWPPGPADVPSGPVRLGKLDPRGPKRPPDAAEVRSPTHYP